MGLLNDLIGTMKDNNRLYIFLNSSFVFIVFFIIAFIWSRRRFYALSWKLPGSLGMPLLGNALKLQVFTKPEEMCNRIREMDKEYDGFFQLWLGSEFVVVANDPKDIECIYMSKEAVSRGSKYSILADVIGPGMLVTGDAKWKKHRRILHPSFKGSVLKSYQIIHNRSADKFVKAFTNSCGKGLVDISPACRAFAGNDICESLFGIPEGSVEKDLKVVGEMQPDFLRIIYERMCKIWQWNDYLFYNLDVGKAMKKYKAIYWKFCDKFVDEHFENYMKTSWLQKKPSQELIDAEDDENNKSVIDLMCEAYKEGKMTKEDIVVEFNNISTPGFDTMFSWLSHFMLMMAMHEKCQERIVEEINSVFADDLDGPVLRDHFPKLKYLDACFKEITRLFPTGPIQMRRLTHDLTMKHRDLILPAQTTVLISNFVVHRNPKYWDSPDEFVPERFLTDGSNKHPNYAYIPFSAGAHSCIGQVFGTEGLKTAAIYLLRNYKLYSPAKMQDIYYINDISVRNKFGNFVEIQRRTQ